MMAKRMARRGAPSNSGGRHRPAVAAAALFLAFGSADARADPRPASEVFGAAVTPSSDRPAAIGGYARGCLAGAVQLPADGPGWQAMRPSRNRAWGHPLLIAFIEDLAAEAESAGWGGLLIGDLAQPRGGPMLTGHASHQSGLDADIWLTPMPDRRLSADEREAMSAVSMLVEGTRRLDRSRFGAREAGLIELAASDPRVARIFVHPAIKQGLCERPAAQRDWLRKVRPWWGHHYHFHVRLACERGEPLCSPQAPPPPGDGCGDELAWWLGDEPWKPSPPTEPARPVTITDLPDACAALVAPR